MLHERVRSERGGKVRDEKRMATRLGRASA